jgi:hypothetical protein
MDLFKEPIELFKPLLAKRHFIDVHIPILEQMVLTDFMNEGYFAILYTFCKARIVSGSPGARMRVVVSVANSAAAWTNASGVPSCFTRRRSTSRQ